MRTPRLLAALLIVLGAASAPAGEPKYPLVLEEDFEKGADRWQPTDPEGWKLDEAAGHGHVFHQFKQVGKYQPTYRSPFNIAILKDVVVEDFVLEADCQSTIPDYNHRDMCLVFGYQDRDHFYYSHLGKKTDEHANQIFIVNKAERTKISKKTTEGTPWTDDWQHVKVVRNSSEGLIEVYFNDMHSPCQTAQDKTFVWGHIGIGSFDDTGKWDNIRLWGISHASEKQTDEKQAAEKK